ncbi:putative peptidyl-tRNA hydrolase PTRHD1 [Trichoplax sp. H2]|nr:putative peptidyl-tRNA hydrolase PTRHD1 [Trichoplax sp. H2]|eukprot:RDD42108.1 putative peptidyl-tRNA hydrolase PTRHD1 [Trichoplax sp. H2]
MASANIVQYIVIRSDLTTVLGWPTGALLAQACHACSAALHIFRNEPTTISYMENLDNMHKVVLGVKDEDTLLRLADKLKANNIDYKIWMEQPENISTCIATRPYVKSDVQKYFKKFKLFA